jgi:hypothetical protein
MCRAWLGHRPITSPGKPKCSDGGNSCWTQKVKPYLGFFIDADDESRRKSNMEILNQYFSIFGFVFGLNILGQPVAGACITAAPDLPTVIASNV